MKHFHLEVFLGLVIFVVIYYYEVFRFSLSTGNPAPFTLTLHSDVRSECGHGDTKREDQVKPTQESLLLKSVEIFDIQMKRQQRLRRECFKIQRKQNGNNKSEKLNYKNPNMIYSDKASVVYCYVPKVACTNWKRVFQVFYGKYKDPMAINKKKDAIHLLNYKYLKNLNIKEIEKKLRVYYSFLISRHPFQRVVSAYRNKLRSPYSTEFQRAHGSKILRLYRRNLTNEEYKSGRNVTFKEFAHYLIQQHQKFGSAGLDEHWRDVYSLCNVCHMKFDFIGDMETLVTDSKHILRQLDWHDKVSFPSNATDKYKVPASEITLSYFHQLTNATVQKLYEIYKKDFEIFGYDVDEFL